MSSNLEIEIYLFSGFVANTSRMLCFRRAYACADSRAIGHVRVQSEPYDDTAKVCAQTHRKQHLFRKSSSV